MNVKIANSYEEGINMEPMELPNITEMQNNLISNFPYDLWHK